MQEMKVMGKYSAMGTPALIINRRVKPARKVPQKSRLIEWLKEVKKEEQKNKSV